MKFFFVDSRRKNWQCCVTALSVFDLDLRRQLHYLLAEEKNGKWSIRKSRNNFVPEGSDGENFFQPRAVSWGKEKLALGKKHLGAWKGHVLLCQRVGILHSGCKKEGERQGHGFLAVRNLQSIIFWATSTWSWCRNIFLSRKEPYRGVASSHGSYVAKGCSVQGTRRIFWEQWIKTRD